MKQQQASAATKQTVAQPYRFVANPHLSTHHKISIFISALLQLHILHKKCHNLCTRLHPPKLMTSLLGLGLNFCIRPETSTHPKTLNKSLKQFCRDCLTSAKSAKNDKLDAQRDIMKQYEQSFLDKDLGGASPSSDFGF